MSHYRTPLENMNFILFDVLGSQRIAQTEKFADATEEIFKAVMDEAAKFSENVLLPTNETGDREGTLYDPECKPVQ